MFAPFSASLTILCFFLVRCVLTTPILNGQEGNFSFPAIYQKRAINDRAALVAVSGSIGATAEVSDANDDYTYLCPITIGGQVLNIDFDTGSAIFWVFSTLMEDKDPDHTYYDPAESSSYRGTGLSFYTEYSDGDSAQGSVGIDTVSILGAQMTGQYFGLASEVGGSYVSDGVAGLAFQSLNNIQGPTFFDNLKQYLTAPLFAAYIPWRVDGYFDFGVIVSSRYTPPIMYTPVDSTAGLWEFDSPSYKVGETVYQAAGQTGYADTGTSFIYMQEQQVENYYRSVQGAFISPGHGWAFPCDANLPDLSFAVGDGGNYATIIGGGDGGLLNMSELPDDDGNCLGALQVASDAKNNYGLTFFSEYYLIFDSTDANNPQLGFANLKFPPGAASGL